MNRYVRKSKMLMSDLLIDILMVFMTLFSGFISFLFLKDVVSTFKAVIGKNRNATRLTPWQTVYHIFFGVTTGAAAVLFLFGIIIYIDLRRNHP